MPQFRHDRHEVLVGFIAEEFAKRPASLTPRIGRSSHSHVHGSAEIESVKLSMKRSVVLASFVGLLSLSCVAAKEAMEEGTLIDPKAQM
jgi:hypothetical protein